MTQSVLILGASSGIGAAMIRRFAAEGFHLILAGRDTEELERRAQDAHVRFATSCSVVSFDALNLDSHAPLVRDCFANASGGLAGVVACHGSMTEAPPAETEPRETAQMLTVNYVGTVSILEACAKEFEAQRSGWICALTSVAGDRGRPSNYLYGSSKAAVSVYLEGLRARLSRVGVGVTDVRPGFVDTSLTWGKPGLFLVASPDTVARNAWAGIRRNRGVVYTPWFWRAIMLIIRAIPAPLFKRLPL